MRSLIVKEWVFNTELQGKVVRIKGHNEDGDLVDVSGVIRSVNGNEMIVQGLYDVARRSFYLYEFGEAGLKIDVWDNEPNEYKLPEAYYKEFEDIDGADID